MAHGFLLKGQQCCSAVVSDTRMRGSLAPVFEIIDLPEGTCLSYQKLLVAVQEATGLRLASRFVNCVPNGDPGMILSSRKIYRDRGLEDGSAHLLELSHASVVSLRSHHPVRHSEAEPRSG